MIVVMSSTSLMADLMYGTDIKQQQKKFLAKQNYHENKSIIHPNTSTHRTPIYPQLYQDRRVRQTPTHHYGR
jgi:hypothetical protein